MSSLLAATEMDPEDMLVSLGFGEEFSTPYHRIPARFFMNPSQANGIDVDDFCSKFLDADHLVIMLCLVIYSIFVYFKLLNGNHKNSIAMWGTGRKCFHER